LSFIEFQEHRISKKELVLDYEGTINKVPCAYYKNKAAICHYVDIKQEEKVSPELFDLYLFKGYRRFGTMLYKNICPHCKKCIPIRLEAKNFSPTKSQRRVIRKNENVEILIDNNEYNFDKFELFNKYRKNKHNAEPLWQFDFITYYYQSCVQTLDFNYSLNKNIIGIGIVDIGKESISTVYYFFDPAYGKLSPGTYSMIKEVDYCNENKIKYYYLGYYLKDLPSMNYKTIMKPYELYINGEWRKKPGQ
jgi:arginyl-tRNA--protein-N-Asp/Glu arginylyltransferase